MKEPKKAAHYFGLSHTEGQLKAKALHSGGLMLTSRILNTLIQLIGTVIMARILTPGDFGLVAMVTAISLLLYNVGFNGFTEAIVQADFVEHKQISTLFWIGLAISSGLAVIFSACSPLIAKFYHEPRLISISFVLSIGFVFVALSTEHLALLMRKMEFTKIVVNDIGSVIVSTSLAIVMALKGFGYWAIVFRQLSLPIISAAMVWFQCPWRPCFPVKNSGIKPMVKFAISTYGNFATNYLGRNLDKVLLGWRRGSQELGNYDRAYRLFVLPVGQMISPLTGVALTTLSRVRHEPERFINYFMKSLSMIALFGMLVSSILTVAGTDIIILLLGGQWHKAGQIFTAFGPSIGITLIYGTHGWLHLSLGTPERWFRWGIIALVINTVMICGGLFWGGIGVAVAYSLSYYLITIPALSYAGRTIDIRASDIVRVLWKYLVAAIFSGVLTWIFVKRFGFVSGPLLRILEASAICTVLYVLSVICLFKSFRPIKEAFLIVREVLPRPKKPSLQNP